MKKLLALILCVMMVASLATNAFAAIDRDQRTWEGAGQSREIIDTLRTNIQNMYGTLAADQVVYGTMGSINDMVNDMITSMLADYTPTAGGTGLTASRLEDAIKAGMKSTIGGEITDYLTKHVNEFRKSDSYGNLVFDPIAYANTFAKAASSAVSSKKAIAGIEAYMTYALQRSTYEKVAEDARLLAVSLQGSTWWGDYGFDDRATAYGRWNVPGVNLDGTLHNVHATYDEYLSWLGQLGVDLDGNGTWSNGRAGFIRTVDGYYVPTDNDTDERVNSDKFEGYWNVIRDAQGNVIGVVLNNPVREGDGIIVTNRNKTQDVYVADVDNVLNNTVSYDAQGNLVAPQNNNELGQFIGVLGLNGQTVYVPVSSN